MSDFYYDPYGNEKAVGARTDLIRKYGREAVDAAESTLGIIDPKYTRNDHVAVADALARRAFAKSKPTSVPLQRPRLSIPPPLGRIPPITYRTMTNDIRNPIGLQYLAVVGGHEFGINLNGIVNFGIANHVCFFCYLVFSRADLERF